MVKLLAAAALVTFSLSGLLGCSHSPESAASKGDKAFASAPPEVKATWEKVKNAIQSNDYAGVLTNVQQLSAAPGLTPAQLQAVSETGTAVSDKMYAAADKGDAKAKEAIAELRKLRSH